MPIFANLPDGTWIDQSEPLPRTDILMDAPPKFIGRQILASEVFKSILTEKLVSFKASGSSSDNFVEFRL